MPGDYYDTANIKEILAGFVKQLESQFPGFFFRIVPLKNGSFNIFPEPQARA
jgi:hypothetical protein